MRRALLISRDPVEGLRLAAWLAGSGETVSAVLLDAAAGVARPGHEDGGSITAAVAAGATVSAHDDALRRRAITDPVEGVEIVDLDAVADLLGDAADRVLWT